MQAFEQLYAEKTGNLWANRESSTKVAGKFYPLEIDYGEDEEISLKLEASSGSKLAPEIQQLIGMIFDIESMKKAMTEFEVRMHVEFPTLPVVLTSSPLCTRLT